MIKQSATERLILELTEMQDSELYSKYVDNYNHTLHSELCRASMLLPSAEFFINRKNHKNIQNPKIIHCLEYAAIEAKKFYSDIFENAIWLKDDFNAFSKIFQTNMQNRGRIIINLLVILRLYSLDKELQESGSFFGRIFNKFRILIRTRYMDNPKLINVSYNILAAILTMLLSTISFVLAGGMDSILISTSATSIITIVSLIFCFAIYHSDDFELTDIGGKNLIALKYRSIALALHSNLVKKEKVILVNRNDNLEEAKSVDQDENKVLEYV